MKKGFWFAIDNMSNFAKSFLVVYALGFLSVPFLINAGFDRILVIVFSITLMLVWTDGFLTLYALEKGGIEINPVMFLLNKKVGKKWGFLTSRVFGSALPVVGLLTGNIYFVLLFAWLFSAVVCLGAVELVKDFNIDRNVKNTDDSNDQ